MKKRTNVTLYYCDHCNKKYLLERHAITHENNCSKNPRNFTLCWNCIHRKEGKKHYCNKKNIFMYSFKAEALGLLEKYPEQFIGEIKMPNTCEDFSFIQEETIIPFSTNKLLDFNIPFDSEVFF